MNEIDPYLDAKRAAKFDAKLDAKRWQAAALADATRARGEAIVALCGGLGLAAALIGASVFVAAKGPSAPPAPVEAEVKEPVAEAPKAAVEHVLPALASPRTGSGGSALALTETDFMSRPEFKSAEYQGRLMADPDGLIRFDTGASAFALAKYDAASSRMVPDRDATLNAARFIGDLAFCRSIPGSGLLKCWALHQGIVIDLDQSESVKP